MGQAAGSQGGCGDAAVCLAPSALSMCRIWRDAPRSLRWSLRAMLQETSSYVGKKM